MRDFSFGHLLTSYRNRLGWTQQEVVDPTDPLSLKISLRTYQKWENEESIPSNKWLQRIATLFQLNDAEAEALYNAAAQVAPKIQNLPFPRNHFFTGRKTYLENLELLFKGNSSVVITQPISISGLGGIGKTQLALEYAHSCYPNKYRSFLWVNAADKATLEESYLSLADLLQLPEKEERVVDRVVQAVKIWLEEHSSWLLILDNADDLQLARSFLPTKPRGHILFTTRSQIVGNIAVRIEVEAMEPEEGLSFLLRRSGILKDGTEPDTLTSDICDTAKQLVEILGGHPLALDQAGAYIEETGAPFTTYMHLYSDQRLTLLNERGSLGDEHPETVVVTFEISFQRARDLYPISEDVLHFCTFLHPDNIPEELFNQDSGLNLNIAVFNTAMKALRRYSLIKRNTKKKTFSIHRLVQAVLQDTMTAEMKKQWMLRTVQAVGTTIPLIDFAQWTTYERYLPHAFLCVTWIEQEQMIVPEAVRLMHQMGGYLIDRAQYTEAERLLTLALKIKIQNLGTEHTDTAEGLNELAYLYERQGRYAEAERILMQALKIKVQNLGTEHPYTATSLNDLAYLYVSQGRYAEAEPLSQRALTIFIKVYGFEHFETAQVLNTLGDISKFLGKYNKAELLLKRALEIKEKLLEAEDPSIAGSLNNLASVYKWQGRYTEAEPLLVRALTIQEHQLGPEHPQTVTLLINLGDLYVYQKRYAEAEPLLVRALTIWEHQLGPEHPDTAACLYNLSRLYYTQGKYTEAEPLFARALAIWEKLLPGHPQTLQARRDYFSLLRKMK